MSVAESPPTVPVSKPRGYRLTPDRFVVGLLVVEGLLWLSERFQWFPKGWAVLIAVAAVGATILLLLLSYTVNLFFRWRFQFSIRSLLVLTIAVAIPCGWVPVKIQQAGRQREAAVAIEKLGGGVHRDRK